MGIINFELLFPHLKMLVLQGSYEDEMEIRYITMSTQKVTPQMVDTQNNNERVVVRQKRIGRNIE